MDKEYEFRCTAGALVRKHLQTILENEQFSGRNIRWMEEKGWLESVFRVRGIFADTKAVESRVDTYSKLIDAA